MHDSFPVTHKRCGKSAVFRGAASPVSGIALIFFFFFCCSWPFTRVMVFFSTFFTWLCKWICSFPAHSSAVIPVQDGSGLSLLFLVALAGLVSPSAWIHVTQKGSSTSLVRSMCSQLVHQGFNCVLDLSWQTTRCGLWGQVQGMREDVKIQGKELPLLTAAVIEA